MTVRSGPLCDASMRWPYPCFPPPPRGPVRPGQAGRHQIETPPSPAERRRPLLTSERRDRQILLKQCYWNTPNRESVATDWSETGWAAEGRAGAKGVGKAVGRGVAKSGLEAAEGGEG